jgi:hypothetical protein
LHKKGVWNPTSFAKKWSPRKPKVPDTFFVPKSAQHPLFTIHGSRDIAQLLSDPLNLLTQANCLRGYLLQRFLDLLAFFHVIHFCTAALRAALSWCH